MARGFIKLDRGLMDHWIWTAEEGEPFSKGQAWVDLLMLANHKTVKAPYKGELVEMKAGTVNRSITWLANRWGWSRGKTRRFLALLEADNMVHVNATTNRTTVSIENYTFYQGARSTSDTTNDTTSDTTSGQRVDTFKNDKNDKNEKNITPPLPPSRGGRKKMRRLDDGSDDGDDYTAMLRKQLEEEMF